MSNKITTAKFAGICATTGFRFRAGTAIEGIEALKPGTGLTFGLPAETIIEFWRIHRADERRAAQEATVLEKMGEKRHTTYNHIWEIHRVSADIGGMIQEGYRITGIIDGEVRFIELCATLEQALREMEWRYNMCIS